jgi:hypothetical protein
LYDKLLNKYNIIIKNKFYVIQTNDYFKKLFTIIKIFYFYSEYGSCYSNNIVILILKDNIKNYHNKLSLAKISINVNVNNKCKIYLNMIN